MCVPILPFSYSPFKTTEPFSNVEDECLDRIQKLYAESYVTNLRNLEAPSWKPVIASLLEAVVKQVREVQGRPVNMAVQQEQPLAPPALAILSVGADSTMTASKHKGTVCPDISVVHYLFSVNNNLHEKIDYLVCAELKRSIKRAYIRRGLNSGNKGYEEV